MRSIAVFCGSSDGASSIYKESARKFGQELARKEITLVYGGASIGVMGAVADAVLEEGGKAIGIMPRFLEQKEISHHHLSELIVVDSMHERKAKMAELAEGFVALPGGPGTLEEFFEIFTWAQLGLHQKPCGLLNVHHYFDPLVQLFQHMIKEQFLQEKYDSMTIVDDEPEQLLEKMYKYVPPSTKKYMKKEQS